MSKIMKLVNKIKYCQEMLDELSYCIINPTAFYFSYEEELANIENDVNEYKKYEINLSNLINDLKEILNNNNYKICYHVKKTIHTQIQYIDVEKYKKLEYNLNNDKIDNSIIDYCFLSKVY